MEFALHIGAEVSLENFSLSQLIVAIKKLFDEEGLPGFLKFFLKTIENQLLKSEIKCPSCDSSRVYGHSSRPRTIKTSLGVTEIELVRLRCQACRKTFTPLNRLLDLDRFSRKSRELEKLSLETIADQSFRRSSSILEDTLGFELRHTTLHRWFMTSKSIVMNAKKRVQTIVADGTGFKKKPVDGSNRGEVRVVVGITKGGEVVPYGAWTEASWKSIGNYLKNVNHFSKKVKFRPLAETLVTDGEEELIRALKKLAPTHQRCLFHMSYDLGGVLQYRDRSSKEEAVKFKKELNDILFLNTPELDEDPLKTMEHKLIIELKARQAKLQIEELIQTLKSFGYHKASNYINNAKEQLFTYVYNWIKTGTANPRVTSLVERMMREIGRRIKKIGHGWSPKGAEKMTRLVLLQITSKKQWEDHWAEKMGTGSNIRLTFLGVTAKN